MGQLIVKTSKQADKMLIDIMSETGMTKTQSVSCALNMLSDIQNGMTEQKFNSLINKYITI